MPASALAEAEASELAALAAVFTAFWTLCFMICSHCCGVRSTPSCAPLRFTLSMIAARRVLSFVRSLQEIWPMLMSCDHTIQESLVEAEGEGAGERHARTRDVVPGPSHTFKVTLIMFITSQVALVLFVFTDAEVSCPNRFLISGRALALLPFLNLSLDVLAPASTYKGFRV